MDIPVLLIIFFASILLICFFAGIEMAFGSANKLAIDLSKKQGTYSGKIWGKFAEHPTRFIGTILIAINIVLVIYGLMVGEMIAPFWDWVRKVTHMKEDSFENYTSYVRLLFEAVVATVIILFLLVPVRAFFKSKSNRMVNSSIVSYFARFFYWMFAGFSDTMIKAAEWILKYVFNVVLSDKKEVFSKIDLEHFLQQSKGTTDDEAEINHELFENALSISDTKLRECLVPRKEIVSIPAGTSIEAVKNKFIETRLSKLVVYDNDIDNITGYVHQLDLFKNPASLSEILLPIGAVPESMSVSGLLDKFSKDGKTIAWVIDEFGGTAGIVTMEDLLEEIFGEIKDEYDDVDELVNKQLSTNEYIFSGRLELDFISEKYQIDFPDNDNAGTLSGYIVEHNDGSIPQMKDRIITGYFQFDILNVSGTRIETVKLKLLK
ncbi:MAG: hemolysin family protein [Ferruginibacter sp.]